MSTRRVAGFSIGWVGKVTIAAIIGILFAKWVAARVKIPGLSSAIAAV